MRRTLVAAPLIVTACALLAGCGSSSHAASSSSNASPAPASGGYGSAPSAPSASTSASTGVATVKTGHGKLGTYLTDGKGLTVYLFEKDRGGTSSACSGACATVWAPLASKGAPKAGPGVRAALLSTFKRADGGTQVAYAGHPLYHYDGDQKPGQTTGQGSTAFGAGWYVVAPTGRKIDES